MRVNNLSCCGIKELSSLSTHRGPLTALRALLKPAGYYGTNWLQQMGKRPYIIFSGVVATEASKGYADKLAAYITQNRLGTVTEIPGPHQNPNSGNLLKMFVWTPDYAALESHVTAPAPKRAVKRKANQEPVSVSVS